MKFKRFINFWVGGLLGVIFLNYLAVGFIDFVLNIQTALNLLQHNEQFQAFLRTFLP
ncbi:hypothetical protein [Nodularia sp. NIES-3585]|uniref:hypothetical protein n=1 Tax=Nodularia sp. NIES-3585 TaxID=1973477 RepID=UPI000B6DA9E5|nr:hypothetical protein [Nodularia sp. NIES-3585]GAX38962.1 hypothetical protein NIES3585_50140 [Nodularia sp. NIES-3585]